MARTFRAGDFVKIAESGEYVFLYEEKSSTWNAVVLLDDDAEQKDVPKDLAMTRQPLSQPQCDLLKEWIKDREEQKAMRTRWPDAANDLLPGDLNLVDSECIV